MKLIGNRAGGKLFFLYRCLLICFTLLVLVLVAGTLYKKLTPNQKTAETDLARKGVEGQIFTGIGQIRTSTAGSEPGTVILFVSFVYHPEDKAFSEELALRIGDFRSIIQAFISSCSILELRKMGDEGLKTELLRRFNSILRLGKIDTLFLTDFMIIG